jgi:magnesium transporter
MAGIDEDAPLQPARQDEMAPSGTAPRRRRPHRARGAASSGPSESFPSIGDSGRTLMRAVTGGEGRALTLHGLRAALADPSTRVWVDLTDPTLGHIAEVALALGLHPLVAENIGERSQRAKIEQVDGHAQIVLFAIEHVGEIHPIEIDFVLASNFLLSVHGADWDPMAAPQLRKSASGPDGVLAKGPDYLFYAFGDWVVDAYFPALDRLADEIDQLQEDAVQTASPRTLQRLLVLKRELIGFRRAASPAREIFNQLTNREIGLIAPEHVVYLRDVYDHLLRVTDELDNYRDLVSGTLEVYLSTINNNLSIIMKRLTGVTVLLAGIGAVAGIFGMSEAGTAFAGAEAGGFWLVAAGTVAVAALGAFILHRVDWI